MLSEVVLEKFRLQSTNIVCAEDSALGTFVPESFRILQGIAMLYKFASSHDVVTKRISEAQRTFWNSKVSCAANCLAIREVCSAVWRLFLTGAEAHVTQREEL
jgi:hypothetical protein